MSDLSTISQADILRAVREFIVENFLFGVDDPGVNDESSFLEAGIVDSTGILELVTFVEERYCISVEDEEMLPDNLDSARNISAFVLRKRGLEG